MLILALAQVLLKLVREKAELGKKKKNEGAISKNRESTKVTLENTRNRKNTGYPVSAGGAADTG